MRTGARWCREVEGVGGATRYVWRNKRIERELESEWEFRDECLIGRCHAGKEREREKKILLNPKVDLKSFQCLSLSLSLSLSSPYPLLSPHTHT